MAERKIFEEYVENMRRVHLSECRLLLTCFLREIDDNATYRGREVKELLKDMWESGVLAADERRFKDLPEKMMDILEERDEEPKPE